MLEKELLQICESPNSIRAQVSWPTEAYGIGVYLRKFGYYPRNWPLNIWSPHGISMNDGPSVDDLLNDAPIILYFSRSQVSKFTRLSSKRCYCVMSPYVFYRRLKRINKDANANGTVAFLAHSTPYIDDRMDFNKYALELLQLPSKFHPITVCLHYNDVNKGIHRHFLNLGLNVVTAGSPYDDAFVERFYSILRGFRYSTSNGFGSYLFYSVEMNIPFFFYGSPPEHFETQTKRKNEFHDSDDFQKLRVRFSDLAKDITDDQRSFVENCLGINHSISRIKFAFILYSEFLKFKLGIPVA